MNEEPVRYEIELESEEAAGVGQRPSGQAARRDMQCDRPAMIEGRRERQCNLAYDLRPHMQRGVGILPGIERERWPAIFGHDCDCATLRHCFLPKN
jgi:hypothetical protein